ncbi:hypothetical protein BGZ57DRAFT_337380 [Hyaloscypha finlandica]|nr:hypothetical protein BGZ57DRAFT_337380 [Hyaloscypha finlandica]
MLLWLGLLSLHREIPGIPERAVSKGVVSGLGFSNVFVQPGYQATAANSFLTNHKPLLQSSSVVNETITTDGGVYNRNGRAYPDIAAVGNDGAMVYFRNTDSRSMATENCTLPLKLADPPLPPAACTGTEGEVGFGTVHDRQVVYTGIVERQFFASIFGQLQFLASPTLSQPSTRL